MKKNTEPESFDIKECKTRLAKKGDAKDLVAIAKTIWSGSDYLPQVMTGWIKEPWFIVCEYHKRVIGCIKLTLLPDNSLWFEGMRVIRDMQGKGIGRLLNEAVMKKALEIKAEKPGLHLEFSTYFLNQETLHMAGKMGFKQVDGFYLMEKYGGRILKEPHIITDYGMEIFEQYPKYLPLGWRTIRNSPEGLDYIKKHGTVFATPKARYLQGGHKNNDITILDPLPPNMKAELPYIQHLIGYKLNFSFIMPSTVLPSALFSLESQKFRFGDENPDYTPQLLVFSSDM